MTSSNDDETQLDESPRGRLTIAPSPPALLAGRYEVVSLLGVGGMGAVYRVLDRELEEEVALKMLRRDLVALPGILERFKTEVKAARKVTSPHVARTFDIGEDGGERFLTMELVNGSSLATAIEAHPKGMPLSRVAEIAQQICAGLAAAHAVGVVHRDLKPDNVLLTTDGSVKITDFGIARVESGARTTQGSLGTPAYMAPEQVTGERDVDARADLYALGVMLYEMVTGDMPWKGDSIFAVASARLLAPPPDPQASRADLPRALADLVVRLMATKKDDRPANASDVAAALSTLGALPRTDAPALVRPPRGTLVAVLPFTNRGGADDVFLAEAITDEIIDAISMSHGLRVFARGAIAPFAGTTRDPCDVGKELRAHVVVHGSVERKSGEVHVMARFVTVADGLQLRAVRVVRTIAELLSAGGDVANALAATLAVEGHARAEPARNPAAVELYLRARRCYHERTPDARSRSRVLFDQAVALAPDDPVFLAGAARARIFATVTAADLMETVRLAERAVEVAPHNADAREALSAARMNQGRPVDAARELRAAYDIAPSNAEVNVSIGGMLGEIGRFDDALRSFELARLVDPTMPAVAYVEARVHALRGDLRRAAEIVDADADQVPGAFLFRVRFAMWARDVETVSVMVARARASGLADHVGANLLIAALADEPPPEGPPRGSTRLRAITAQMLAEIAASRDRREAAIANIEDARDAMLIDLAWLEHCPIIAPLLDDPRVRAVHQVVAERARDVGRALDGA